MNEINKDLQARLEKLENIKKPGTGTIERSRVVTVLVDVEKKEIPSQYFEKVEYEETLNAFIESLLKIPSIRRRIIMKDVFKIVKQWSFDRIDEPSSYQGIVIGASALGYAISPEMVQQILVVAGGLVGLIELIKNERHQKKEKEE